MNLFLRGPIWKERKNKVHAKLALELTLDLYCSHAKSKQEKSCPIDFYKYDSP